MKHLEDDLDDHEELCDAINNVAKILGSEHVLDKAYLLGAEQLRDFRLGLIALCAKHMQRQLLPWEMEVCLFPPMCATCHKFHPNKLINCKNCLHTKWCSIGHKPKNHDKYCDQLILFRKILQKRIHVIHSLQLQSLPENMGQLLTESNDQIEICLLSEIATSPFSLLNALPKEMNDINLTIHVVGPEPNFEANNLVKWEAFLFDLLPSSIKLVNLIFIGPEIGPFNTRTVTKAERRLEFKFHQLLYHEYVNSNGINMKPNLIAALNPGLYRNEGFQGQDTWSETISAMFLHSSVPVLITAYTEKEIKLDYKRIKDIVKNIKVIQEPSLNPFSSQRPLMNFVSDEASPVVFKNAYYTILTS